MSKHKRDIREHSINIELLYNALEYLGHLTIIDVLLDVYFGIKPIDDAFDGIEMDELLKLIDIQKTAINDYKSIFEFDYDISESLRRRLMKSVFDDLTILF